MRIRVLALVLLVLLLVPAAIAVDDDTYSKIYSKQFIPDAGSVSQNSPDLSYSAGANYSISKVYLYLDEGEGGGITITLADGTPIYGSAFYGRYGADTQLDISLQSQSDSARSIDITPNKRGVLIGYGYDSGTGQTGIIIEDERRVLPSGTNCYVFYPVSQVQLNLIQSVSFQSNDGSKSIEAVFYYGETADVTEGAGGTAADQIMGIVNAVVEMVFWIPGLILELVYWFKFIFVDNLLITVGLYFGLTMAVSFGRARDVFDGIQKFIQFQRTFWEFIAAFVRTIIGVFESIKNVLLPW